MFVVADEQWRLARVVANECPAGGAPTFWMDEGTTLARSPMHGYLAHQLVWLAGI